MLSHAYCYAILGLDAYLVTIEIDIHRGLPLTNIVGLPDSVIKESKERVRSAIKNSDFKYPNRRITINLSPAHTKKEGPSFDLAIALGILVANEQLPEDTLKKFVIVGELSLDGSVNPVKGSLPIALGVDQQKFFGIILPQANADEASLSKMENIFPVQSLEEAVQVINNPTQREPYKSSPRPSMDSSDMAALDFNEVKGQIHVKRGLEIAASGGHNVLMIGPPGCGKSMLAKRFPSILPDMSTQESLETTKIYSVMGLLNKKETFMYRRPFRSVHHTTSAVALVGGGTTPRPGEITLSHNGVLFLDELPEFSRPALESLRQPLEDQCITIARANKTLHFPAKFTLLCAMNPCPCGHYTNPFKRCQCSQTQIQKYLSKISGPLLDRIDIHLEVPALLTHDILNLAQGEASKAIKQRTAKAKAIQYKRFYSSSTNSNASMTHKEMKLSCQLNAQCRELLSNAIEQLNLSARAHDKIIRIARTIADMDQEENIMYHHIAEAVQYRSLDRNWWG